MRCRCFATFFCSDGVFVILFRGVAVWTVPQCPPHYHTRNPLRNCNTFFPKKKTNLLCILTRSFNIARFEHENEMRRKALRPKKNWNPALSGIRNPVVGIRNPKRGIQNPRLSWIPSHGAINVSAVIIVIYLTVGDLHDWTPEFRIGSKRTRIKRRKL